MTRKINRDSTEWKRRWIEEYGDLMDDSDIESFNRSQGRSTARSNRGSKVLYTQAQYPPAQRFIFANTAKWDDTRLNGGIKAITFGPDFEIRDFHLDAIAANPEISHSLRQLTCGNSDNGYGSSLSDAAVIRLASVCPSLIHVTLESSIDLTDRAMLSLVNYCPQLQCLTMSGHHKGKGHLKGSVLDDLRQHPCLGKNLKQLYLADQGHGIAFEKAAKNLSAARKTLRIQTGDSGKWGFGMKNWEGGKRDENGDHLFGGDPWGHEGGFDDFWSFNGGVYL